MAEILRHSAILGWTAELFKSDSPNLAQMFLNTPLTVEPSLRKEVEVEGNLPNHGGLGVETRLLFRKRTKGILIVSQIDLMIGAAAAINEEREREREKERLRETERERERERSSVKILRRLQIRDEMDSLPFIASPPITPCHRHHDGTLENFVECISHDVASVVMQILSYPTETVLSNKIMMNTERGVLSIARFFMFFHVSCEGLGSR